MSKLDQVEEIVLYKNNFEEGWENVFESLRTLPRLISIYADIGLEAQTYLPNLKSINGVELETESPVEVENEVDIVAQKEAIVAL